MSVTSEAARAAVPAVKNASDPQLLFEAFDPTKGQRFGILDERGNVTNPDWLPELSDRALVSGYKFMLLARLADVKAVSLQRQGRLYTLPPSMGQEACAVGSAMALEKSDWMVPAYRELGAWLYKGAPLKSIYLWFSGSEYGNVFPAETRILPTSVPIASQCLHATGIAHAIRYRGGSEVVIVYFGDGGTSEGDFHEALNWAAVFSCPVVFFCNNNQYAISHPRERQTRAKTIAQKAVAYGMPGIQVDGNDLLAVYRATKDAVEYARAGNGPVLIEGETYRMAAHTTSDDPTKYRDREEEERWKPRDPLLRMKTYLISKGIWDDAAEAQAVAEATQQIDDAARQAEAFPANSPDEIFNHVFAELTPELKKQKDELKAFLKWKEGR